MPVSIDLVSPRTWINPYYGIQMRKFWLAAAMTAIALLFGCGKQEEPVPRPAPASAPPGPTTSAPAADSRPAIVCFGNSITAGFGLEQGQSFPALLQQDLDRRGLKYRVVNLGVSGDTTQDGVARLAMAVAEKPAIVLLELGANDGLR